MGNRSCKLEGIGLFLGAEAESVESNVSELQLLGIVDRIYFDLSLAKEQIFSNISDRPKKPEEKVIVGVCGHEDQLLQTINDSRLNKLEEDVVAALVRLLVSHTGLLK